MLKIKYFLCLSQGKCPYVHYNCYLYLLPHVYPTLFQTTHTNVPNTQLNIKIHCYNSFPSSIIYDIFISQTVDLCSLTSFLLCIINTVRPKLTCTIDLTTYTLHPCTAFRNMHISKRSFVSTVIIWLTTSTVKRFMPVIFARTKVKRESADFSAVCHLALSSLHPLLGEISFSQGCFHNDAFSAFLAQLPA